MRQRIVIELEGEEQPLEGLSNIVRETVISAVLDYRMNEIRDFSIRREILPEEVSAEILVPEFLNLDKMDHQVYDRHGNNMFQGEGAVQDG